MRSSDGVSLYFRTAGFVIFVVLLTSCILRALFCHVGVSALALRGSFPAGGVPQSHAFPLPSAFCCEHGGRNNLIALGGELEEEGLCFSFGHSRTWVEKQVPGSKASELAFGHPRCTASTPSVFACQRAGVGWGEVGVSVRSPLLSHRK